MPARVEPGAHTGAERAAGTRAETGAETGAVPRAERRRAPSALARELAAVEGLEVRPGEPLARHSTFRIGGPAEVLVLVHTEAALGRLLEGARAAGTPFHLLGLGSNVLFPDGGVAGVVARLEGEFKRWRLEGTRVVSGAAVALGSLAKQTAERGLTGLEALSGFPSTVGGAVCMNAGSYGTEIADVLVTAGVLWPDGRSETLTATQLEPAYRTTRLQGTAAIVTTATLQLASGDPEASLARIEELNRRRWKSLPSGRPNAGSVFRNPPGDYAGRLIEACGLKGETLGGARISPEHANVIVNEGGATAFEVLELMRRARRAVAERFGVWLEPEIVLAGELGTLWRQED